MRMFTRTGNYLSKIVNEYFCQMFGHCVQQMWIFNELMTFDDVTIWLNDWLCLWMLFRPLTGNYFTAIKTNAHTRGRMTCFLFLRAIFSLILVWFFLDVTKDVHLNFSSFSCISITHKIVLMRILFYSGKWNSLP